MMGNYSCGLTNFCATRNKRKLAKFETVFINTASVRHIF